MSDPNFHIETPRLYVTFFQASSDEHCDFLVTLYNTPEFIAAQGRTSVVSRAVARERMSTLFAEWHARNGYGQYLVALKPSSFSNASGVSAEDPDAPFNFQEKLARCKLVGNVSLMRGSGPTAYGVPDLGFEAAGALVEYVRKELGVGAVLGFTDPANEAAKGVFRSLGFEDRGVRKLTELGGHDGSVWITPGAAQDLSVYNL
ncbi:hypothetical protein C8Q74DRAFT_1316282 [Fomes fomentarius]|nr:hypothetical protein C8Q74DRAFT_1316282 [Fomes fomentarius]